MAPSEVVLRSAVAEAWIRARPVHSTDRPFGLARMRRWPVAESAWTWILVSAVGGFGVGWACGSCCATVRRRCTAQRASQPGCAREGSAWFSAGAGGSVEVVERECVEVVRRVGIRDGLRKRGLPVARQGDLQVDREMQ